MMSRAALLPGRPFFIALRAEELPVEVLMGPHPNPLPSFDRLMTGEGMFVREAENRLHEGDETIRSELAISQQPKAGAQHLRANR